MKIRPIVGSVAIAVALFGAERSGDVNLTEEGKRWWAHIEKLASDDLKGRDVGSEGFETAARYVAGEFEKAGLLPGGPASSPMQTVRFIKRQIDESQCSISLIREGKEEKLILGEDANIGMRTPPASKVEAELVFVGYGLKIPEHNYDDLKDLNLRGKIAVFISGQPVGIPGALVSHYQSASERSSALLAAGALGTAAIPDPKVSDIPWARATLSRLMPTMSIDEKESVKNSLRIALTVNAEHADKFFAGSGHTIEEIFALSRERKALPHFPLKGRVLVKAAYSQSRVESMNVIGILPGTDPELKHEFIVVSAHLDHVGVNDKLKGDQIFNGAMDNASGVASLIEAARHIKQANLPLKRSVAFVALTGEEKGLLGSTWYAQHPLFGKEKKAKVVGDLNMDMYLPLFPLQSLIILGVDESTLGDLARKGAEAAGIEVWPDPEPERNSFIRSDQYSFIRNGTPSLAFKFGYKKGTPEASVVSTWLKDRYHSPKDDLEQPVDKEAAAKYNRVLTSIISSAANSPEAPRWKDASFFKRFAKN